MAVAYIYATAIDYSDWTLVGTGSAVAAMSDGNAGTYYHNYIPTYARSLYMHSTGTKPADMVGATITAVEVYFATDLSANKGDFYAYLQRDGQTTTTIISPPFTNNYVTLTSARPGGGSWVHSDFYISGTKWGIYHAGNADDNTKWVALSECWMRVTYTPVTAPVAAFTVSTTTGTAPLTVQFTDQGTNTPTSWLWTFGDGNTATNQHPLYVYTTVGTYTVTLTETNGGGSTNLSTASLITVLTAAAPVDAAFNATPLTGVQNLGVQFTDFSQGTPAPNAWLWNFGDSATSTEQHPLHVYTTVGTYTVTLTASNATPTTDTETKLSFVTVSNGKPVPAAACSTTTGVRPLSVQFTGSATNAVPTGWDWDFGDGGSSVAQSPLHVYNTVGTYTPILTVENAIGTASTTVGPITVGFQTITASFTAGPLMGYVPLTTRFTDQSEGDAFSWQWAFGDTETAYGENPVHVYMTNSITETYAYLTITETGRTDDPDLRNYLTDYWKLEEGTGTGNRANFIRAGQPLVPHPSGTFTQITGKNAYGVRPSSGANGYLENTDTSALPQTATHSYTMWFMIDDLTTSGVLLAGSSNALPRVDVNSRFIRLVTPEGSNTYVGETQLAEDTWYHLVFTFDGTSRYRVYLNGVLELSATDSTASVGGGVRIGYASTSTLSFDEVGRFDIELGADQVAGLYNGGDGNFFNALATSDINEDVTICPILPDRTWGYFFEELKYQLMEPVWDQDVCEGFEAFGGIAKAVQLTQQRLQRFVLETRALRKETTLANAASNTEDFSLPGDLIELLRVEVTGVPYYPADPYQRDRESLSGVYIVNDAMTITIPGVFGTTPTVKIWYTFVPTAPSVPAPCTCPDPSAGAGPWEYFPIPYVLWWIIRYGVIADMLNQPGERNDPARAGEAEKLWQFGVEIYKMLYRGSD